MDKLDFCDIIEWLYVNHENYKSAAEWRKALVEFLKSKIIDE